MGGGRVSLSLFLLFLVAAPAQNIPNTAPSQWSTFNASGFAEGAAFVVPDVTSLQFQINEWHRQGDKVSGPAIMLPIVTACFVLACIMNVLTDVATAVTCTDMATPKGWHFVDKKSRVDEPLVLTDYSPALLEWCPSKDHCLHEGFKLSSWNPTTMNNSGAIVLMVHSVEAHGRWTEDENPVGADDLVVGINCHPLIEGKGLDAVHDLDGTVEGLRRVNVLDYFGTGAIVGVNILHEESKIGKWCPHDLDYLTYSPDGDCGEHTWGKTPQTNFGGGIGELGSGIKERKWFNAARDQDRAQNPTLFDTVNVDTLPQTPPHGRGDWLVRHEGGLHKRKDSYFVNQLTSIFIVTLILTLVFFACYWVLFGHPEKCEGKLKSSGCLMRAMAWSHDSDLLDPNQDGIFIFKVAYDVWIVFPVMMFLFLVQHILHRSNYGRSLFTGSRKIYLTTILTVLFVMVAITLPARQWSMLQDWDARFNGAVLVMHTIIIWLNHILMTFFLYDATVKFCRGYGLNVEPLVDDNAAALILGVSGAAASTMDFIDHGRDIFGHADAMCYFGGLGRLNKTAEGYVRLNPEEKKITQRGLSNLLAEAQYRVPTVPQGMAGQYEYRLSCPGVNMTYEELMTVPDHKLAGAPDGDACLLSCRWSTAQAEIQTTPIMCGANGFDGARWSLHTSMETVGRQLCPPPPNESVKGRLVSLITSKTSENDDLGRLRAEVAVLSAQLKTQGDQLQALTKQSVGKPAEEE